MIARRIFIAGNVQGVFFREWAVERAGDIGVRGWIRNLKDGRVEVLAIGEQLRIDRLIECLRVGSPMSRVDGLQINEAEVEKLDGFSRRQTA